MFLNAECTHAQPIASGISLRSHIWAFFLAGISDGVSNVE